MKVRRTTFDQEQKDKEDAWFRLTPAERLAHHYRLLLKVYGERMNQPLSPEARIVRIKCL